MSMTALIPTQPNCLTRFWSAPNKTSPKYMSKKYLSTYLSEIFSIGIISFQNLKWIKKALGDRHRTNAGHNNTAFIAVRSARMSTAKNSKRRHWKPRLYYLNWIAFCWLWVQNTLWKGVLLSLLSVYRIRYAGHFSMLKKIGGNKIWRKYPK